MTELLEVRKAKKSSTASAEPWPSSLYARPSRPAAPAAPAEAFVAEDIAEGCRLALQTLGIDGVTSLGITSSLRAEGRTTLALAMALVLADHGADTVLVELDLAHPSLGQRLAVAKYPGLGDLAAGLAELSEAMHPIRDGLKLIPAGQIYDSIPHALSQLARADVLGELANQGHTVVADLPPLLGNSMGRQAASMMADLVLVVRAGVVPAGSIKEAVAGLPVTPKVLLNGTHTRVPSWALRLSGI